MSVDDLTARVDDWLQQNTRWGGDSVTHVLSERITDLDGSGETFHALDVRFLQEDTKANIQQKFEDKLKDKVAWYRVGYHACGHDIPFEVHDVSGESWVADLGEVVQLEHEAIRSGSEELYHQDWADNLAAIEGEDYQIIYDDGVIMPEENSIFEEGETYLANYQYTTGPGPCSWDDATEWTAKDVTIPDGVPSFDA